MGVAAMGVATGAAVALEATPPSALPFLAMKVLRSRHARAREVLWEALQARGTGWVRAIWVAAAQRSIDRCLFGLLQSCDVKIWAPI